jgi:hypothetical protein
MTDELLRIWKVTGFEAGILLGLFDPEDGSDMFLRNISRISTHYSALYPRSYNSL